ncbi:MAG: redox-regulated ATPase YchF [Flavobacteriales bacterium AspAUS03]
MKCGIVGLPNVGKSTLFNCLSSVKAQSANFPFCTIEPNIGMVQVPDKRLNRLGELVRPQRVVPAVIEIVDIAGLVKGAHKGEGLGNQFLSNIRETQAIIHVLRCFEDEKIIHIEGYIDPIRDKELIDTELQLKDLETVEKCLEKSKKQAKSGSKEDLKVVDLMQKIAQVLSLGKNARTLTLADDEIKIFSALQLLTAKPELYLCNVDEISLKTGNPHVAAVKKAVVNEQTEVLILAAQTEADIAELETYEERKLFLYDLGLEEPGFHRLIHATYVLLNLQTYFTIGIKEVRAWTIQKGWTAPEAASVIHTDFQKGFIRADVIHYEDFIKYGSEHKVREAGKMSVEGKDYIVQDGDIIHFRFNVSCIKKP